MARTPPRDIQSMADLRVCIDEIDRELVQLLAERERYTDRAPDLKAREGIAARAPRRVTAVLDNVRARAEACGLDPELAEAMWTIMIETVIAREERVIGKEGVDG
ncbi:chorismate mutase [Mameliella sediminis]|uniref:chorismate mutase n=1 Tax=Mameliella sediminis TaxID=2836866 RepID=UPI001C460968|nr:chorismate mutase [Mameliella sediminis]MBY6144702.1 chorismate mutase [Mameliella alba]MBV7395816.1 chorismate mutase [Mameliella sediminis]MBY6160229.1 chorismate mutase [Mameliella alba]MBY6168699.1 chorismate mutase [Mameliella alba]MBY6174080.1 chorismate mutase [Mameliella alba]